MKITSLPIFAVSGIAAVVEECQNMRPINPWRVPPLLEGCRLSERPQRLEGTPTLGELPALGASSTLGEYPYSWRVTQRLEGYYGNQASMKYDDSLLILFLKYDFDHEENTYPLFLPDCPGERGFCPT